MTKVATRNPRLGDLIQNEYGTQVGFCRKTVAVNEASEIDYKIGTVLSETLSSGSATATADAGNTGDGTFGAVTVGASAKVGNYRVVITNEGADAGSFDVTDPDGDLVGSGTVAVEFIGGGLTFTIADGAADFDTGDAFTVAVAGDITLNVFEDGEQFSGIYIGSPAGDNAQTIPATTDTNVVILYRGPCAIGEDLLVFGDSVDSAAKVSAAKAQIEAAGFKIQEQPNQFA